MQKYFSRGRWQVQSRKKLLSHVCNAYCTLTTLQLASLDVWLPCDEDWLLLLLPQTGVTEMIDLLCYVPRDHVRGLGFLRLFQT